MILRLAFLILKRNCLQNNEVIYQYDRIINEERIEAFPQNYYQYDGSTIQPVDEVRDSFESNQYIFSAFVGFSKTFDTVNHKSLIKTIKVENKEVKEKNILWFISYLRNRTQFLIIIYGAPQGSIMRSLYFLLMCKRP